MVNMGVYRHMSCLDMDCPENLELLENQSEHMKEHSSFRKRDRKTGRFL